MASVFASVAARVVLSVAAAAPTPAEPVDRRLPSASAGPESGAHRAGDREQLSGDWGGLRNWLADRGVDTELYYTVEAVATVAGGIERAVDALGNLDMILDVDLEQLAGWGGARLLLYGIGTHGGNPTSRVGDLQATSNIEAPYGWRLFEAYLEQDLWGDVASLRFGLQDLNTEFDVIPGAAFFIHSSFGMGADIGTSGVNGPSTFPVTSLALRLLLRPLEGAFLRWVVADGVPQDPSRPGVTRLRLGGADGVLVVGEIGLLNLPSAEDTERVRRRFEEPPVPEERDYGKFGKFSLGLWTYTTDFEQLEGPANADRGATIGGYVLLQQSVVREADDPREGMSVFARAGGAEQRGHLVDVFLGGGLTYDGVFELDGRDHLGLGVAAARPTAGRPWEVAVELTYRVPVLGWLSVQPDVQFVSKPAADPRADDALIMGLRALVTL